MTAQIKVVGFKTLRGREGEAYEFNVKKGNSLLGEFHYDGWGGPVNYDFPSDIAKNEVGRHVFDAVKEYMLQETEPTNVPEFEMFKANEKAIIRKCHTWQELQASEVCKGVDFFEWYANMIYELKANEKALKKLKRDIVKNIHVLFKGKPGTYVTYNKLDFNPTNVQKVRAHVMKKYGHDCFFIILEPEHVEKYGIGVMEEAHYALENDKPFG